MSGRTPRKEARSRGKPYDRPDPSSKRANRNSGLLSFVSTLFWGKQTSDRVEREDAAPTEPRDEVELIEEGHSGVMQEDDLPEMQEVRPPAKLPAPPPRKAQVAPFPTSVSSPNLARAPTLRRAQSPRARTTEFGGLAPPPAFSQENSYSDVSRSRGDILLRDVDQLAIPTAFTPHFDRTIRQSTPRRDQSGANASGFFSTLPVSRTMPSLSQFNSLAGASAASRPPVARKQLYLGPGYSAQNIARRRREQNMLSRSQTLSARPPGEAEPLFKRRRLSDPPLELPKVKAAIAQQPSFNFTFMAPLPSRPLPSAPVESRTAEPATADPTGSATPLPSSPKRTTRAAELIRGIFNEEKATEETKTAGDLSNPYQNMDNPIARVVNIKPQKSVRVPREQIRRTAAPMTPLQRLQATAPAVRNQLIISEHDLNEREQEFRSSGKRARTEESADVTTAAAKEAPAAKPSLLSPPIANMPPVRPSPPAPTPVAAAATKVSLPTSKSTAVRAPSKSTSPFAPPSSATSRPKASAATDVEMIDLDASEEEDDANRPPPAPATKSVAASAPAPLTAPAFSYVAPVKEAPSRELGSAKKEALAANPFAALASTEEEEDTRSEAENGILPTVAPRLSTNMRSPLTSYSASTKSSASPYAKEAVPDMPAPRAAEKPALPVTAIQTPHEKVKIMPASSLPTYELLSAHYLPARVASADREAAALATAERDLPTFALLT